MFRANPYEPWFTWHPIFGPKKSMFVPNDAGGPRRRPLGEVGRKLAVRLITL